MNRWANRGVSRTGVTSRKGCVIDVDFVSVAPTTTRWHSQRRLPSLHEEGVVAVDEKTAAMIPANPAGASPVPSLAMTQMTTENGSGAPPRDQLPRLLAAVQQQGRRT